MRFLLYFVLLMAGNAVILATRDSAWRFLGIGIMLASTAVFISMVLPVWRNIRRARRPT